ncbi:rod shape-determining protein MreC [Campylobacter sp. JMF_02 ED1]|uniref:rod shape-determining protein MreC n=1 Tax=unclassified Campylobacter TaxID=2593542 RepID=UPI001B71F43E|nr:MULTISPECIES: rod shape-determining protein MreC [unclassified Campylobacter]MBP3224094.1 rod shape-determining protein MreC [Campylobacter sp.]MDA3050141.1 rod shape-determining protein MreC [Campylobacter sp. JMF_15 NE4]MDA3051713.1 rod shape-determining protein MreC [Campylobacter sp. JMF_02 ED1]
MTNVKFLLIAVVLVATSLIFGSQIHGKFIGLSGGAIDTYKDITSFIKNKISKHIDQANTIEALRAENEELKKSAMLLGTFAGELNKILLDKNSSAYEPRVELARTLSYASLNDYNKFWINFKNFNPDKVYGLISEGKTAGIVVNRDNKPLAILQKDEKSNFSVSIGESQIPGVANGEGNALVVKFIPQWLDPKVGDEVYTSGKDEIFFEGVPVGRVKSVQSGKLYKSAVIEPYANPNMPTFLYVVTKER